MKNDRNFYFISGPTSSALTSEVLWIEPVIHTLCAMNNDDPDDYTATMLTEEFAENHWNEEVIAGKLYIFKD